jgi:hypothetical protein
VRTRVQQLCAARPCRREPSQARWRARTLRFFGGPWRRCLLRGRGAPVARLPGALAALAVRTAAQCAPGAPGCALCASDCVAAEFRGRTGTRHACFGRRAARAARRAARALLPQLRRGAFACAMRCSRRTLRALRHAHTPLTAARFGSACRFRRPRS